MVNRLIVDAARAGQRIDNFLLAIWRGVPRSRIYRALRGGEVRVNAKRIKPHYRIQPNDQVRLPPMLIDGSPRSLQPSQALRDQLQQRLLFENDDLLIISKPAGLAVHGGTSVSAGLINALRAMRPDARFLELVHRLDKATSGCVCIAKKRRVLLALHELFANRKVDKHYILLVKGQLSSDQIVDVPLRKNILSSGERVVRVHPDGKSAVTKFHIIKSLPEYTLLGAQLLTGRTHQIRVHAAHMGHPIVGDEKYGDRQVNDLLRARGLRRLLLHADRLEFTLDKEHIKVLAPLDHHFKKMISA